MDDIEQSTDGNPEEMSDAERIARLEQLSDSLDKSVAQLRVLLTDGNGGQSSALFRIASLEANLKSHTEMLRQHTAVMEEISKSVSQLYKLHEGCPLNQKFTEISGEIRMLGEFKRAVEEDSTFRRRTKTRFMVDLVKDVALIVFACALPIVMHYRWRDDDSTKPRMERIEKSDTVAESHGRR